MHVRASAAVLLVCAATACGPSFQAVYEGNARFEHCYALEENTAMPMRDKAACWRDWSEHYTFGQTRDRVHYATARYVALSQAADAPTDEAMMMAAPGEAPRQSSITAPTPSNAFAPPPKVLEAGGISTARPRDLSAEPVPDAGAKMATAEVALPQASCADTCGGSYRACSDACEGGASKACQACEKTYRSCMRGCFK